MATKKELLAALKRLQPWIGRMIADGGHLNSVAPNDAIGAMQQADAALASETHEQPPAINQVEMTDADIEFAERIAQQLGFTQTAYTSSSSLWGLFCLRDNPAHTTQHVYEYADQAAYDSNCRKCGGKRRDAVHNIRLNYQIGGCIIKTAEFGFMFVADLEDMQLHDLHQETLKSKAQ